MLVVDASVVAPLVADAGEDGDRVRQRVRRESLVAPELLRVEVVSVLRRQVRAAVLDARRADDAIDDLLALPVTVYPTDLLLRRAWSLRDNVTPYDAAYVALAEALDCPLLTADAHLARAPGPTCPMELI